MESTITKILHCLKVELFNFLFVAIAWAMIYAIALYFGYESSAVFSWQYLIIMSTFFLSTGTWRRFKQYKK